MHGSSRTSSPLANGSRQILRQIHALLLQTLQRREENQLEEHAHLHCEFSLVEPGSTSLGWMNVVLWLSKALCETFIIASPPLPRAAASLCK
jgi:hypothetical protein